MPRETSNAELARQAYVRGDLASAEMHLVRLVGQGGADAEDRLLLGIVLARQRKSDEASVVLLKLIADHGEVFEALTWLAVVRRSKGEFDEALECAERAVRLRPEDASAHASRADCLLSLRRLKEAIADYRAAIGLDPSRAELHHNLALAFELADRGREAVAEFQAAIALDPSNEHNYLGLSRQYLSHTMVGKAIECLSAGISACPGSLPMTLELARAFSEARNSDAAERLYKEALRRSPVAKGAYANWLQAEGRFSEARAISEEMIAENPAQGYAFYNLIQVSKLTEADRSRVDQMENLARQESVPIKQRLYLEYALGRAHDQLGGYEGAMAHFDEANRLAFRIHNQGRPFDHATERVQNDALRAPISARYRGSESEAPIFIVGMIRSGTTLLEQIVSSHPRIAAAGELRFWVEEGARLVANAGRLSDSDLRETAEEYLGYIRLIGGGEARVTDKMPLNYRYLGPIHTLFPRARILHIRRNPVDTCLSIHMTYFGGGPNFAYDKTNVVFFYREYLRLMEWWRSVIPDDAMMELDYEDLIADQETVTHKILNFCGLEWNDACLRHQDNRATVNTPSRWQARQPIYASSVARWRLYEPYLDTFADLIEQPTGAL